MFTLIIISFLVGGLGAQAGAATAINQSQQFVSQAACEAAAKKVAEDQTAFGNGLIRIKAVCVSIL